jgi:hypothetical protein
LVLLVPNIDKAKWWKLLSGLELSSMRVKPLDGYLLVDDNNLPLPLPGWPLRACIIDTSKSICIDDVDIFWKDWVISRF